LNLNEFKNLNILKIRTKSEHFSNSKHFSDLNFFETEHFLYFKNNQIIQLKTKKKRKKEKKRKKKESNKILRKTEK
jgi:hypothetical protein